MSNSFNSGGITSEERDSGREAGTSTALDAEDSIEMLIITPLKELNMDVSPFRAIAIKLYVVNYSCSLCII